MTKEIRFFADFLIGKQKPLSLKPLPTETKKSVVFDRIDDLKTSEESKESASFSDFTFSKSEDFTFNKPDSSQPHEEEDIPSCRKRAVSRRAPLQKPIEEKPIIESPEKKEEDPENEQIVNTRSRAVSRRAPQKVEPPAREIISNKSTNEDSMKSDQMATNMTDKSGNEDSHSVKNHQMEINTTAIENPAQMENKTNAENEEKIFTPVRGRGKTSAILKKEEVIEVKKKFSETFQEGFQLTGSRGEAKPLDFGLLEYFLGFLREEKLNLVLAGYFEKVFVSMMGLKNKEVIYFKSKYF